MGANKFEEVRKKEGERGAYWRGFGNVSGYVGGKSALIGEIGAKRAEKAVDGSRVVRVVVGVCGGGDGGALGYGVLVKSRVVRRVNDMIEGKGVWASSGRTMPTFTVMSVLLLQLGVGSVTDIAESGGGRQVS